MAFPQPNAQRELANRKILEELHLKKQMLLKQGATSNLGGSSVSLTSTPITAPLPVSTIPPISATAILPQMSDTHMINTSHRAALNNANATSCGFFVPQDSSFGNQILPVLPRFDTK
ncbi:SOSS complex subunit C homolog B [Arctopsyche grandis]|uniref:SOSS complex subunit C homolog B n=1 Tax=Arctopsyche grandis TaxID=121162 RepID=UPI00406D6C74